ncbi:MAG: DUF4347 domain-containing protein, partial [Anaerolineae bacterium]|nr:DUF4347 domain-containing protein [Anaerolineae bacterium]
MHRHHLSLIFVIPFLSIFFLNSTSTPQPHPDLVIIDSNVKHSQHLINALDSNTIALVLNPERDGVAQITSFLEPLPPLNGLHIISHGSPGSLQLGAGHLQADTLDRYADQLRAWSAALTTGGDILLYGCNVAQGEAGAEFVTELSQLTGADIAASINPTGSAILGGDWVLEFTAGATASDPVFAPATLSRYPAVLSRPVLDTTGNPTLPDINQGVSNPDGILLADLLGTTITDTDTGSIEGVAITATSGDGTWQYSLDGVTWSNIGAVSDTSAVVLNSVIPLYDGPAGGFPTDQGWLTKNTFNGVGQSGGVTSTTMDTSADSSKQDGYSNYTPDFMGGANLINGAFPNLSATNGYTLRFEM